MMEAKKTMTAGEIAVKVWDMAIVSGTDGYYTVRTNTLEWAMDEIGKIHQAGIREVVEWFDCNATDMPATTIIEGTNVRVPEPPAKYILGKKWQAQKKVWLNEKE